MANNYGYGSEIDSPSESLDKQHFDEAIDPDNEENQEERQPTESDEEILNLFNSNKKKMEDHWDPLYCEMEKDWDMYTLDQWTQEGKVHRSGRPLVTVDISRKYPKAVVSETYDNPPGIKLTARRESASDKSKALSNAIRYFEDACGAIYSYSWAKECMGVCGLGWLKVGYNYDETQEIPAMITVDRVEDPLSIMIDVSSKKLDGSDALYGMEIHGEQDDKKKYTYWWVDKEKNVNWALISDGEAIDEKGVWPGGLLPLVPCYGEFSIIRDKKSIFGLMRQLKGTQQSFNFAMSEGIERIATTPKSPLMAANGAISKSRERDYRRAVTEPVPYLEYNAYDESGRPIPPPTRSETTPDTSWLNPLLIQLQQNAKETTGIYAPSLGEKVGDESGVAIKANQKQGDRGQLVYSEHLQASIKRVGTIMLDIIEPVIGPGGLLPMLSEEGDKNTVSIGQNEEYNLYENNNNDENLIVEDLDTTSLDISVSAASAYATRKEEGLDSIKDLMPYLTPDQQSTLTPHVIKEMGFPGSERIAQILAPEEEGEMDPAMMQAQFAELQNQLQQASKAMEDLQNENTNLQLQLKNNTMVTLEKARMDNQTEIEKTRMNIEASLIKTEMTNESKETSDNKGMITEQFKQEQTNNRLIAEIAADAEKENAKIVSEAQKQNEEYIEQASEEQVNEEYETYD